ncbi:unnamed protein product, partial [Cylicocyclus nassatus]
VRPPNFFRLVRRKCRRIVRLGKKERNRAILFVIIVSRQLIHLQSIEYSESRNKAITVVFFSLFQIFYRTYSIYRKKLL